MCWTPCTFKQCDSSEHLWVNDFSHRLHLYGLTPVCVLVCLLRSNVSLNPLPQNVHKYRFTSEWHFICRFKSLCKLKFFEQTLQTNFVGSSSLTNTCLFFSSSLCLALASVAKGFFTPCPPLMNSRGSSAGSPNCKKIMNRYSK